MTSRDPELDRITELLGQCLGRIDEHAYRLQDHADLAEGVDPTEPSTEAPFDLDALEREAEVLQELVQSALRQAGGDDRADLNRVVESTLQAALAELDIPVVVRQNLATDLPRIGCNGRELAVAAQRALVLAVSGLSAGDEIAVVTRPDNTHTLLEIEFPANGEPHLGDRATTLQEFVAELGGHCHIRSDARSQCLIAIELPTAVPTDG